MVGNNVDPFCWGCILHIIISSKLNIYSSIFLFSFFFFNVGFLGVLVVAGFCTRPGDGVIEVGIFGA